MENATHEEDELFVSRAITVVEYVNSQRIFLIGKPLTEQFNQLICGYGQPDFKHLLVNKMTINKRKTRHEN